MSEQLKVALFGSNGHQIHRQLAKHPQARLVAAAEINPDILAKAGHAPGSYLACQSLGEILALPDVDLVSLCSPRRGDQAAQARACMEAGKHVYAEKPCALTEQDLDAILTASRRTGRIFREMAGTAFVQPYVTLRQIVQAGTIGQIVQVSAQKSYPWHERRPENDAIDGGLIRWVAVHAFRLVEHISGLSIVDVQALESSAGHPTLHGAAGSPMAASMVLSLTGGAVAHVGANYLNTPGTGVWGYEEVRLFGTKGIVESTQGGKHTRLVVGTQDRGPLDTSAKVPDYFDFVVQLALGQGVMPLTIEEELNPTRMVIRAKRSARRIVSNL